MFVVVLVLDNVDIREKKVLFYGVPVGPMCSLLIGFLEVIPNFFMYEGDGSGEVGIEGLPLMLLTRVFTSPYVSLCDFDVLKASDAFIIGSSNQLIYKENKFKADIIINTCNLNRISMNVIGSSQGTHLTTKDKFFMAALIGTINIKLI